jgi:hypothetical protein
VSTLAKYEQSARVMTALQQVQSDLLKPGASVAAKLAESAAVAQPSKGSLEDQLKDLQRARDQGLITQAEYDRKRQEILSRY